MATQKTIAQALGISQPAVGAVLGKHSGNSKIAVSPELREQILAKARELGYRPNIFAQALSGVRTKTVGLIHYDSSFPSTVEQKSIIAKEVFKSGYRLNTLSVTNINITAPETMYYLIDQLIDMQVDGAILSYMPGYMPPEQVTRLLDRNIPVVSIRGTMFPGIPYFGIDMALATTLLVKHLLRLGYRRLLLCRHELSPGPNVPKLVSEDPRVEAFKTAIEAVHGHIVDLGNRYCGDPAPVLPPLDPEAPHGFVCYLHSSSRGQSENIFSNPFETGSQRLNHFLDLDFDVDVILFPNDLQALGGINAACRRNIRVPQDIGITGFDGTLMGQYHTPTFTSMGLPTELIANRGVRHLTKMIGKSRETEGEQHKETHIELYPCKLLTGETTCLQPTRGERR